MGVDKIECLVGELDIGLIAWWRGRWIGGNIYSFRGQDPVQRSDRRRSVMLFGTLSDP